MDDLYKNLESGDKIIDIVSEERVRSDAMQSESWAERTNYRNNEIPPNPPYKAKVYNLSQLTCEDFRSFLIDSGITIVKLEEHNGFCVEVQTPDDLAFIVSLDGEYYEEEHGEDDPPIKVRVLYESRYNNHYPLTELTRDMLQGAGAGGLSFRTTDSRPGVPGFSRENMGALDHGPSTLDRAKFATSDNASVDTTSTNAPLLNFRDSGRASLPVAFSRPSDPDLAFRQKGLSGDLGSMRSGTSCISSYQPAQQKRTYQPPQLSSFASKRSTVKKTVDENGWTING
ncbi:Hypothetical protein GLP15_4860 [Giardia lamblia P15]|uniref:Uncharacterized protein n=1 Tax=Giardia intestinalis (strain P15) TaxID=658858 RepID=E1EYB1_GIAIA|nr:Hypothetical protein GLP15_4860 [Giardia lamblia P15]